MKQASDKNISDEELVLLYYGEHDDPGLAARVARDADCSARFEALGAELRLADRYQPPTRGDDYGPELWRRIAPRLAEDRLAWRQRLASAVAAVAQPRFSAAGVLGIVLLVVLAYSLGRGTIVLAPAPVSTSPMLATEIDPQRLLTASVADHLDHLDLALTEFVNTPGPELLRAGWAMDMLVSNRLYRQSASVRGDRRLAGFLADIEPLLIELAYGAQTASEATHRRMQDEVRGMLFRVRVMNNRLKQPQLTT